VKKVLFVFGNVYLSHYTRFIPAAIPILSGVAKSRNWEVDIFDARNRPNTTTSQNIVNQQGFDVLWDGDVGEVIFKADGWVINSFQEKIDKFKPDLIAVTETCHQNFQFLTPIFLNTKIPSDTPIIVGGVYPTIDQQIFVNSKAFDLVCVGEGEDIFNSVLERIENNNTLENVEGTIFVDKNTGKSSITKRKVFNPSVVWNTDPDYSIFEKHIERMYGTESNRGCPFNCGYCGNTAMKTALKKFGQCKFTKYRPIESLFKELETSIKRIPTIEKIRFIDSSFLCGKPIEWLEEFADRYSKTIGSEICWETYEKAEFITDEKLGILKKCGCKILFDVGVESGSEELLRVVCNRNCKSSTIIKAFNLMHKYGISAKAMIIIGLPHETRNDVLKTTQLLSIIKPDSITTSVFSPLPGTALGKFCVDKGYVSKEDTYKTKFIKIPEVSDDPLTYPITKMPEPYLSQKDVINFWRVLELYVWLPEKYFSLVEKCEKDYSNNKRLFAVLCNLKKDYHH